MSKVISNEQPEFDFWEFVACARCHLPFSADSGAQPPVPFWVTECGHVLCNNHLKPDQSCAECGTQGVQVAPLQRELDAPMSEWFHSAPQAMDTLAYTTRFQIETLASSVRYYKRKCSQQHILLERSKADSQEIKLLRQRADDLQTELQHYRENEYGRYEPSEVRNTNGKRRMTDVHRHQNGIRSNSSPRSVTAPIGPDRLTLPPKHAHTSSRPRQQFNSDDSVYQHSQSRQIDMQNNERPGSSRFAQQFSYNPPPTQQLDPNHVSVMSHSPLRQSHPATFLNSSDRDHPLGTAPPPSANKMPPPPLPRMSNGQLHIGRSRPTRNLSPQQSMSSARPTPASTPRKPAQSLSNAPQPNHFLPPLRITSSDHLLRNGRAIQSIHVPATPSGRFAMPTPISQYGSNLTRSNSMMSIKGNTGGQRRPFIPKSG